jgi:DNA-binding NarL/FixJ family response regulator
MHHWQARGARIRNRGKPLPLPVDAVTDVRRPAGAAQGPIIAFAPRAELLILAERRDFVRSCIACWLDNSCGEFATLAVSDVESLDDNALTHAAAVLIGAGAPDRTDGWLCRQIEWLRTRRTKLPIMMIVDAVDADEKLRVETLAARLGVQGYIPTSSSVEVAVAAMRLVMVGGRYFPAIWDEGRPVYVHEGPAKLTPREVMILGVLSQGAPNKIIAHQLGIAVSTVKLHVHNIIRKLNVHSRTEAIVVARAIQPAVLCTNGLANADVPATHHMPLLAVSGLAKAVICGVAALAPSVPLVLGA